MKEKALLIFLIGIIIVSVFLTYQRSFVWQNFELINSEEEEAVDEEGEEEGLADEAVLGEESEEPPTPQ